MRSCVLAVLASAAISGCSDSTFLDDYLDAGMADVAARDIATNVTSDAPVVTPVDSPVDAPLSLPDTALPQPDAGALDRDATTADSNTAVGDASQTEVDAGSDSGIDASLVTATITATLSAAQGGDVPLGLAKLSALKGSVATDKVIVMTSSNVARNTPNGPEINGMIYNIEPVEMVFAAPVELTLPLATAIKDGKSAFIAVFDEFSRGWIGLPTKFEGDNAHVSVLLTRGGRYAVFEGDAGGGVARQCPSTAACGGPLLGTFTYASSCSNVPAASTKEACSSTGEADVTSSTKFTGEIAFFAGGSFSSSTKVFTRADVRSNAGCTAYFRNVGDSSCADIASRVVHSGLYSWLCSGSMTDRCFCTGTVALPDSSQDVTGTFIADGGGHATLTSKAEGTAPSSVEYCVQGNSLTLRDTKGASTASKNL